jgi:hypothetical protein
MVSPVIGPGCPGLVETVTVNWLGVLDPHALFAVTVMVPEPAPTVVVIDVEVEVPLHPDGRFQLYDVAPDTGVIL